MVRSDIYLFTNLRQTLRGLCFTRLIISRFDCLSISASPGIYDTPYGCIGIKIFEIDVLTSITFICGSLVYLLRIWPI